MNIKDKIFKVAESYKVDKEKLYIMYKYEKKNKQWIFENNKSNLDEYKNNNPNDSYYGLSVCIQSKKKKNNLVEFNYDSKFNNLKKKLDLTSNECEILYIILLQLLNDFNLDYNQDRFVNKYILNVPDFGLLCSICKSPLNFVTRQVRSADEGDKTFAVCTKNNDHIFSTDRFTINSENQDSNKEVNILLDR